MSSSDLLISTLLRTGYARINAADVAQWAHCQLADLVNLSPAWNDMPLDQYLKDGGKYRRRRHSCFVFDGAHVEQTPHRAHWQSLSYNALHGGMERWFEPLADSTLVQPVWQKLLLAFGRTAAALQQAKSGLFETATEPVRPRGCIEAHQFRIDTAGGIGRPTPEGAHRDGVDLVAVFMVNRQGVKGGETRVFDAQGTTGERFTLSEPWSLVLLDDTRVVHETTPIQPLVDAKTTGTSGSSGYRDTLVLTCNAHTFQQQA